MKKFKYVVLIALVVAMLTSMFSFAGFGQIDMDDNVAPYSTAEKRLMSVFEYMLLEMGADSSTEISEVKLAVDFAGNKYYVVECSPLGYMIYCEDSGMFTEYTPSSPSPYLGKRGELYYGGPTFYYYREDADKITHTISTDETVSNEVMADFAGDSKLYHEYYMEQSSPVVLDYIENGANGQSFTEVAASVCSTQETINGSIYYPTYFSNMTSPCGMYSSSSLGSYTILAMLHAYLSYYRSAKYVDIRYFTSSNRTNLVNGSGSLAKYIRDNFGPKDNPSVDEIKELSYNYCESRNVTTIHRAFTWGNFDRDTIIRWINMDSPTLAIGSYKSPATGKTVNHTILIYKYVDKQGIFRSTKYTVHFGWDNYSSVTMSGTISGVYCMG